MTFDSTPRQPFHELGGRLSGKANEFGPLLHDFASRTAGAIHRSDGSAHHPGACHGSRFTEALHFSGPRTVPTCPRNERCRADSRGIPRRHPLADRDMAMVDAVFALSPTASISVPLGYLARVTVRRRPEIRHRNVEFAAATGRTVWSTMSPPRARTGDGRNAGAGW